MKELANELGVKVDRVYRWRKLYIEREVSKKTPISMLKPRIKS
ncbi:hypothetical protein [Aquimarina aquimarini]